MRVVYHHRHLLCCKFHRVMTQTTCVILLHLLMITGAAFLTGGARVVHQDLHPTITQPNHTLLIMGVLALLLPTAFFTALDRDANSIEASAAENFINTGIREQVINISRELAILLLLLYVSARIFLINPPGKGNAGFLRHSDAPIEYLHEEERLVHFSILFAGSLCLC
ncbi:hypothetical protein K435DRAFT_105482 [Dendrothele bispora CBS 962.96]|uniref:Uncharacterized protein n=1 Tax=Dendrothele bispora (strain CBS 962.96) TaxID=1314807 RepID=A0A4S8MR33_DENBC|nr:hypothetical protein K435DRAFT_105482 [Dendrothele bispora CBS 962.96]